MGSKDFSFDIVSEFDKGEMNNVFDQARRELASRYDFKGTAAAIEWSDEEKDGLKIIGESQYQLDAIIDMVRKKAATRNISQKVFDVSHQHEESNLKLTWSVPFLSGLDQEKAKKVTKLLRDKLPKVKTQIQGEEVRVSSPKKDELQAAMAAIKKADFDFPLTFTNYR